MTIVPDDPALTDPEISDLLVPVYVGGGFTDAAAAPMLAADKVRARGTILTARVGGVLAGMVILVAPDAPVRQIAHDGESEVHLLAVRETFRGRGIARALMAAVVALSRERGWPRVVLSTQETMAAAQALYASAGFVRAPGRDWTRGERRFLAYELATPTGSTRTTSSRRA